MGISRVLENGKGLLTESQRPPQPPRLEIAKRILELQKPDEIDAAFARRLGVSAQVLQNWKDGKGVSIDAVVTVLEHVPTIDAYALLLDRDRDLELVPPGEAEKALAEIAKILERLRRPKTTPHERHASAPPPRGAGGAKGKPAKPGKAAGRRR